MDACYTQFITVSNRFNCPMHAFLVKWYISRWQLISCQTGVNISLSTVATPVRIWCFSSFELSEKEKDKYSELS